MKKLKLLLPIIISSLILITVIMLSLIKLPIDPCNHTHYEYFSLISTFISGIITPIITIVGFLYLYYTFSDSSKEKKISNIYHIIEKYEDSIDTLLCTKVYNKKTDKDKPWETTISRNLILNIDENIEVEFFYDEECKSKQNLISPIIDIRKGLYYIAENSNTIESLDSNNKIAMFYRLKYSRLINALTDEKHYFTKVYSEYKEASNITNELNQIDNYINKFYSKNHLFITEKRPRT